MPLYLQSSSAGFLEFNTTKLILKPTRIPLKTENTTPTVNAGRASDGGSTKFDDSPGGGGTKDLSCVRSTARGNNAMMFECDEAALESRTRTHRDQRYGGLSIVEVARLDSK